jgi:hypothetical protein
MRLPPLEAASSFVNSFFPNCHVAILGGSVSQQLQTPSSDLDIVIIDETYEFPFRKTYREFGWLIEAFVLNRSSYRYFFDVGIDAAIPSLQRMCVEGILLKDSESWGSELINEARNDLQSGPLPWSQEEQDKVRYEITEYLEDLTSGGRQEELFFTVHKLIGLINEFVLRTNRCWMGEGKWMYRSLESYDSAWSSRYFKALGSFYRKGNIVPLSDLILELLAPYGGLLAEGYSEGN